MLKTAGANRAQTGGSIDNTPIGATTPSTGAFTTLSATGVTTFAAGTVALPSITTSGDTNTGVYFPAADTIAFTEGGAEAMRISSAGLLGIGTTNPGQRLHVVGNVGVNTGVLPGGNGSGIAVFASDFPRLTLRNTTTGDLDSDGFQMYMVGNDVIHNLVESGYQAFFTAAVERVRIDSSGNVGIGATANASAILDAQSTTKGVRMPNMTTTQKNAIATPAAGLMVFDTTLAKLCVYSGAAWQTITSV
jgi:hypothetical protein